MRCVLILLICCAILRGQFINRETYEQFMNLVRIAQGNLDKEVMKEELDALTVLSPQFSVDLLLDRRKAKQIMPDISKYCKDPSQWAYLSEGCATDLQGYFCALLDWVEAVSANCSKLNETACAECLRKQNAAKSYDGLWPWRAVDAIGKPPAYLLSGHFYWMGEYEMCKRIDATIHPGGNAPSRQLHGQYCVAGLGVKETKPQSSVSKRHRRSVLAPTDQPTTRSNPCPPPFGNGSVQVPPIGSGRIVKRQKRATDEKAVDFACGESPIRVGFCLPDTCNATDAHILALYRIPSGCYAYCETEWEWTIGGFIMLGVIGVCIFIVCLGAVYDVLSYQANLRQIEESFKSKQDDWTTDTTTNEKREVKKKIADAKRNYYNHLSVFGKLALCVSLYSNGRRLFGTKSSPDAIPCLNGIRVLGMAWVTIGHTYIFGSYAATNVLQVMQEYPKSFVFQILNNATVSVDVFFTLSGFLVTYLFLIAAKRTNGARLKSFLFWIMFYVHRYIRLTPLYAMVILLATVLYPNLPDGPLSIGTNEFLATPCREKWWQNLLYVSNLWGEFDGQCIGWSWYLANDMQFYVFSPIILTLLWWFPFGGIVVALLLAFASATARGLVTNAGRLPPVSPLILVADPNNFRAKGADVSNLLYGKPWMRVGPFLIGMIFAYIVVRLNRKARLHWMVQCVLWLLAFGLMSGIIFGLYPYVQSGEMNEIVIAIYAGLFRTGFGLGVAIVIFMCATGNGGLIDKFLSCSLFAPLSRLTYAAYLAHEVVIFYFYFTLRKNYYSSHSTMVEYFLGIWGTTYLLAVGLSLLFEAPIIQLEKLMFSPLQRQPSVVARLPTAEPPPVYTASPPVYTANNVAQDGAATDVRF